MARNLALELVGSIVAAMDEDQGATPPQAEVTLLGVFITVVSQAIAVLVSLSGIRHLGAVVDGIGDPIPIAIGPWDALAVAAVASEGITIVTALAGVDDPIPTLGRVATRDRRILTSKGEAQADHNDKVTHGKWPQRRSM